MLGFSTHKYISCSRQTFTSLLLARSYRADGTCLVTVMCDAFKDWHRDMERLAPSHLLFLAPTQWPPNRVLCSHCLTCHPLNAAPTHCCPTASNRFCLPQLLSLHKVLGGTLDHNMVTRSLINPTFFPKEEPTVHWGW